MGEYDPDKELFEPLQKLLDQCKGAKALSRKVTKRLEDLTQDSGALKAHLLPQLRALNNLVPDIVDFGISVRNIIQISCHIHLKKVASSLPKESCLT